MVEKDRIGEVTALGLDEVLFARLGKWRTQHWSTQPVDVRRGQLLDVVPGRNAAGPCAGSPSVMSGGATGSSSRPSTCRARIGGCSTR